MNSLSKTRILEVKLPFVISGLNFWFEFPGMALHAYNDVIIDGLTRDECLTACVNQTFTCRSVEFQPGTNGRCTMTSHWRLDADFVDQSGKDYYERLVY